MVILVFLSMEFIYFMNHSLKAHKQLFITLQHRLIIKMSQYTEHLSNIGEKGNPSDRK